MRPIKFRAWDRIDEKIYYDVIPFGEFVVLKYSQAGYEMLDIVIEDYDLINYKDFSDYEIMQYTGLKDKNGVEIYEGDIIKLIGTYKDIKGKELGRYMVEWNNYYTGFYPLIDDPLEGGGTEYEVIGNVYENPEL